MRTEAISSVCTEDVSSVYAEDISSVYTEDISSVFAEDIHLLRTQKKYLLCPLQAPQMATKIDQQSSHPGRLRQATNKLERFFWYQTENSQRLSGLAQGQTDLRQREKSRGISRLAQVELNTTGFEKRRRAGFVL